MAALIPAGQGDSAAVSASVDVAAVASQVAGVAIVTADA